MTNLTHLTRAKSDKRLPRAVVRRNFSTIKAKSRTPDGRLIIKWEPRGVFRVPGENVTQRENMFAIAEVIRSGEPVVILQADSGQDVTARILAHILFEEEAQRSEAEGLDAAALLRLVVEGPQLLKVWAKNAPLDAGVLPARLPSQGYAAGFSPPLRMPSRVSEAESDLLHEISVRAARVFGLPEPDELARIARAMTELGASIDQLASQLAKLQTQAGLR